MTVDELKLKGAREFITEGPNSGGVRGYLYLANKIYSFWDDTGAAGIDGEEDVASFVAANINNENARIRDLVIALNKFIDPNKI